MRNYFGEYFDFETSSKKDAAELMGANNMVGDIYDIKIDIDKGVHKAWMVNRFDQEVSFFNPAISRQLSLLRAEGLTLKAILSFVAFTESDDGGFYWGSAAVIGFNPSYKKDFEGFLQTLSSKIGEDVRPKIDFDKEAVQKVISSHGTWVPTQTVKLPEKIDGTQILARKRNLTDKFIAQGRAGNKGCYIGSWIVLLALVTVIVFACKSCFGW